MHHYRAPLHSVSTSLSHLGPWVLRIAVVGLLASCGDSPSEPAPQAVAAAITNPPEPAGCTMQVYDDHEYWFCTGSHTANDAATLCDQQPWMHLARVDDEQERDFLEQHFTGDVWIGGSDALTEGQWLWLDNADPFWSGDSTGSAVDGRYEDWASSEPNDSAGTPPPPPTLVSLWDPADSSLANPPGSCTIHGFDEAAYWTCTNNQDWDPSRSDCQAVGADLISINSQPESDFINSVATGLGTEWLIGAQKRGLAGAPDGTWQWVDGGDPIGGFSNWGSGEPDWSDCSVLVNGYWRDWSCSNSENWVCEEPSALPVPDAHSPVVVDLNAAERWFEGSTQALTNGVSASVGCGASSSARDAVFWFNLAEGTTVSLDLGDGTFGGAVVALFKDTLDNQGYAEAGSRCATPGAAGAVELEAELSAGAYYAVITATSSGSTGSYELLFDGDPAADCTVMSHGNGWRDDSCNAPSASYGYICESDVSDCEVGDDSDDDGVPDCFDGCPNVASHQNEGQCGCPDDPDRAAAGTSCSDGLCPANRICDGEGNCGSPDQCAPDTNCTYVRDSQSGYFLCQNERTADEARAVCQQQPDMHLVHVDTEAENDFLVANMSSGTWINATDATSEGVWLWADDATQFWQGDESGTVVGGRHSEWLTSDAPDNLDGLGWPDADCAAIDVGLPGPVQTDAWADFACNDARQTFPFVCEIPLSFECLLSSDLDLDGVLDCRDSCPLDPERFEPGDCGCADTPMDAGTACGDGWCAANNECDGNGICGDPDDCAPVAGCTPIRYEGKPYWFCEGNYDWVEARDLCRSQPGLDLVRIDSQAENDFLVDHITDSTWIGANDRDNEWDWFWAEDPVDDGVQFWDGPYYGDEVDGLYSNWDPAQPNDTGTQDCAEIFTSGLWNDASCSGNRDFVCETVLDECVLDPIKLEPGACGCGVTDVDGDGDGTPDCLDECPADPDKILPLWCGCGSAETDSDGDETPDCVDACPSDADKVALGQCGCGVPDDDTDGDGIVDCLDLCPLDPLKTAEGSCGCGVTDVDSDDDGSPDCLDLCPFDPDKLQPHSCGCGVSEDDTDGDATLDCFDECPDDPTKVAPGDCGCANAPQPSGTPCDDGLCAANDQCDGAGTCGAWIDCAPSSDCQISQQGARIYFFCPTGQSWDDAEAGCAASGFDQVRVDDAAEDSYLEAQVSALALDSLWLGARDYSEATWTWQDDGATFWSGGPDGSAHDGLYSNWGAEQPDDLFGDIIYPATAALTQLWDEDDPAANQPTGSCSAYAHAGEIYWYCSHSVVWDTASSRCQAAGAKLVSINDAAEDAFVYSLIGSDDVLIGVQKRGLVDQPVGTWQWLDGTDPFGGYSNWGSGEPDSSDCGAIEHGTWEDWSCSNSEQYICEVEAPPLAIPELGAPQMVDVYGASRWFRGHTRGLENSVDGNLIGCGSGSSAPDAVFAFTLTNRTHLTIDLSGSGTDTRVGIFKDAIDAQGYADAGSECATTGSLLAETLDPGDYFAVVTGPGNNSRSYEVLFEGVRQGESSADCALHMGGVWIDTDCEQTHAYACEVPYDECPNDGSKLVAGVCGCGNPDIDSDGDGTPDCLDRCPDDAYQVEPGGCGCESAPMPEGTPCGSGLCPGSNECDGAGRCGDPMDCAPEANCVFAEYPGMSSRGYFFCPSSDDWEDAQTHCSSQPRTQLARIDDPTENDFVSDNQADVSWLGANDRQTEAAWYWHEDGQDEGTQFWSGDENGSGVGGLYTNWDPPHEPNDLFGEDCGLMLSSGRWADVDCDHHYDYVCEVGQDLCPDDWDKWEPGICGCGIPDDDSDSDGLEDCFDYCPFDASRSDASEGHCDFTFVGSDIDPGDSTVAGAADGNGQVLFVWQTNLGRRSEIHGRRFDEQGSLLDWSPLVFDRLELGWPGEPKVAGFPGGGWVVVWTDIEGDADRSRIAYSLVAADGSVGPVRTANANSPAAPADALDDEVFFQWSPAVSALDDGFVVAWVTEGRSGIEDTGTILRARRFDLEGDPATPAFGPAVTVAGDQLSPAVASSGQQWIVVWDDAQSESVRASRFAGSAFEGEVQIAAQAHSPAVAVLTSAGNYGVAWVGDTDFATYATTLYAGLGPDAAALVVQPSDGRTEERPSAAHYTMDAFGVAFQYADGYRDSDFSVVDIADSVPTQPDETTVRDMLRGASNQRQPVVVSTPSGLWISWVDDGTGYYGGSGAQLVAFYLPAP